VSIEMPEEALYLEGIQIAKRGIAADIQRFLEGVTTVKFAETFKAPPKKTETKPETAEAKKTEVKPEEKAEKETAEEAPKETKTEQTAEAGAKT